MKRRVRSTLGVAFAAQLASCAPSPSALPPSAPEPPRAEGPGASREEAHRLVIAAAACWFGGTWSDALGEEDAAKEKGAEARCRELEGRVWAGAADRVHDEQLRALETNAVADVVAKVDATARVDGVDRDRREALVRLTTALADAQREVMFARRAATRVRRDLDWEPEKLAADEVDAVGPLRTNAKLEALINLEAGELTPEARALGLLLALDRVELARGLPKHLKLYAVADEFHFLFGVTVPGVPADATTKLVPGTWLKFLSDTAAAAGHPVGREGDTPRSRDALAWAGMLEGFGDKLDAVADKVSPTTPLMNVVMVTKHRLEAEFAAERRAYETRLPSHDAGPRPAARRP
jgi:hypothetical protein